MRLILACTIMLNITLRGAKEVKEQLDEIRKRLSDFGPYFKEFVAPELHSAFDELFEKQGASPTRRWRKLAASTIAQKRRKGWDMRILHRKGRLRAAYSKTTGDSSMILKKKSLVYQNRVPYAIYHEEGTPRMAKRTVIARVVRNKNVKRRMNDRLLRFVFSRR